MKQIITLLAVFFVATTMVVAQTQTTLATQLAPTVTQPMQTVDNVRYFENGDTYYHKRISYNENKATNHVE